MNKVVRLTSIMLLLILVTACATRKEASRSDEDNKTSQIIPTEIVMNGDDLIRGEKPYVSAIIYKTQKDYYHHVPVILSEDKSKIISYPAITDLHYNGKWAYPTVLDKGYLLDNRGINKDVAFLSYTYKEYASLKATPSKDELFKRIIDNDPLMEIYDCGKRSDLSDEVGELNEIIKNNFGK